MFKGNRRIIGDFGRSLVALVLTRIGAKVEELSRKDKFDLFIKQPDGTMIHRPAFVKVKTRRLSPKVKWGDVPPSFEEFKYERELAEREGAGFLLAFVFYNIVKGNPLKLQVKAYIVNSNIVDEEWFITRTYRGRKIKQLSIDKILSLKPEEAFIVETSETMFQSMQPASI